ncbi:YbhB/YbcL family Raf kinase inhibitor-like protein [Azospirillum melinis]|uniref:YbhB/YbcL family Raf kinase inhibitor-like protein n=1 Tax=Azospirillum melinis TaxID=328839 RepID=A0ABX2K2B7_9PROT|nr:YbhB/YbcL family Raf kinase inhibitor-like protein [Azospirillum melinis]MBP2305237.1 Raf kinase inhibitor-like YbhB/YbcL family protein [Azospirillum melinis]NUA97704.1 YbhB/YbcL family Raf kinase inhibitor-like protein [Azospirillum melinis]
MPFTLHSPAFANGQTIPPRHTADGDNVSPPLEWSDAPAGTRSYALIVEDPDAPGETFLHWAVYNIAAERDRLPEGTTQGAKTESLGHGINDHGHAHYDGPNPPCGHTAHHYRFRLMALDVDALGLGPKATVDEVRSEAGKHLLGEAELVGTYAHPERTQP